MNTPLHPDDISRFITGRIIGSLAAGQVPWRGTMPGLPEYALTGEPFTGVNVLLLWQASHGINAGDVALDANAVQLLV